MLLPGDRIGPYRILGPIGSGGMGHVFAATHEHMGLDVAIKVLSQAAAEDPQLVARHIQEARALAQIRHPGVVRIHNCERLENGTIYLAMERLDGITLREWIRREQGPAPLDAALEIARQIADAMIDVKPLQALEDLRRGPASIDLPDEEGIETEDPRRVRRVVHDVLHRPPRRRGD